MTTEIDEKLTAEHMLLDCTQRAARSPAGRRAVVMHLSRLKVDNRRSYRIRVAANIFEVLVKQFEGEIFLLTRGDIVFLCKDPNIAAVDEAVMKVRNLFGDDPLASALDGEEGLGFASWYDLGADYPTFAAYVERVYQEEMRRQKRLSAMAGDTSQPPERLPMEPAALGELVAACNRIDISNLIRRQAVCNIAEDELPRPLFREVYVSIGDLRDQVMPRRDVASDPWLFKYLTHTLDKQMLILLRRHQDPSLSHSFSLNLNVASLLSPEFLAFDASLRSGTRSSIVLELEKIEIFADLGAYLFARDFVRERGYRICLDGVTPLTLPFLDRERLGIDLVKVFWSPELIDPRRGERTKEFIAAVERCGKSRVVLARCDSADAIRFGHSVGLRLFQGRHVDRMLNAASGHQQNQAATAIAS